MNDLCSKMVCDPRQFLDAPYDEGFTLGAAQLEELQLTAARALFGRMRSQIQALARLADERRVEEITNLEQLARVLFPHTIYKSYPLSLLARGEFARLTRWLEQLTTEDLGRVDLSDVRTLDDWIERLDATTSLRVVHTFGTSGKLSLVPRSRADWRTGALLIRNCIRHWPRNESAGVDIVGLPVIQPSYRYGASAAARGVNTLVELSGVEDNALFLYPNERYSADVAAFAGRLARAGSDATEAGDLPPQLLARAEQFAKAQRDRPHRLRQFLENLSATHRGRDVYLFGLWPTLYEWAEAGLQRGLRGVFGSGSVLHTGGGNKGAQLLPGWRERVFEFLGFDTCHEFYTMTELIPACPRCEEGNYHIPPVLVPLLLDPVHGTPLPRRGLQTGRLAFLDLLASSYWGGFVSGDQVTLGGWEDPCACGRLGPYVLADIRRFTDAQGGDDKVDCAAAAQPYAEALELLASVQHART